MFRIKSPRSGWEVRSSVSVQPVQSWKCEPDHRRTNDFSQSWSNGFGRFLVGDRQAEWRGDHQRRAELQEGATADATLHQALINGLESLLRK